MRTLRTGTWPSRGQAKPGAVMRVEDVIMPRGPTRLAAGDQLLAVVTSAAHDPLIQLATRTAD